MSLLPQNFIIFGVIQGKFYLKVTVRPRKQADKSEIKQEYKSEMKAGNTAVVSALCPRVCWATGLVCLTLAWHCHL